MARFRWLSDVLGRYGHTPRRVLEFGCFDAKTIDFLPRVPDYYRGLDANWDGGLDEGRRRWSTFANVELTDCTSSADLPVDSDPFDTVIAMETLEHLPADELDRYLDGLTALTSKLLLISVPNEIGPLFAAKWLFKAATFRSSSYHYTFREFIAATLGRTDQVERNQHKGFNYRQLIDAVAKRCEILEVTPLPLTWLPVSLGITIGIVAKPFQSGEIALPRVA